MLRTQFKKKKRETLFKINDLYFLELKFFFKDEQFFAKVLNKKFDICLKFSKFENSPFKMCEHVGCPRLHETPVLEPAVMKKIAHERLTALIFRSSRQNKHQGTKVSNRDLTQNLH